MNRHIIALHLTMHAAAFSLKCAARLIPIYRLHAFQMELPYLLGPTNPCPTAVHT